MSISAYLFKYIDINPKELLAKGALAKKISMDKLQPFCRDVPEYEIAKFSGGTRFRNGDTIMARITPCLENGKTAMVNILEPGEVGFGSTEFIVFRAKEGYTDPNFVYYLVKSSFVRDPAIKSMVGSSGRQRVQTDVVQNLIVPFPSLLEQRKIASILKSLDDKIALNTAINDNLAELCKTEFMRTFATHPEYRDEQSDWFSHPLGKSLSRVAMGPFGSNIKTDCFVDHGVPVLNGDNISGYLLSERSFRYVEEEKASQLKNSIAVSGDIVITHRGTLGQVALVPDKTKFDRYVISQSQFLLTCDQCTLLPEYILFYFHTDAGRRKLLANDNTTGVPSIAKPTSYIKALHIPIPPIELQQNWAVLVRATLAAVADNNLEMEKLTGFAQTLLSGLSR